MIQIEDDVYEKLLKDANDNRQVVKIAGIVAAVFIFIVLFFSWGRGVIDLDIQRRTAEMNSQIALANAETNAKILEIERGDMPMAEYVEWLKARK